MSLQNHNNDFHAGQIAKVEKEAELFMLGLVKKQMLATYTELTNAIQSKHYDPRSSELAGIITKISERHGKKEGALSSVIVRKDSQIPGDKYFEWLDFSSAESLDRKRQFHREQISKVYKRWAS